MDSILVCSFTDLRGLYKHIENIKSTYDMSGRRIFVFENYDNMHELYCTFNINKGDVIEHGMIPIHRKSDTNTLYTINALNRVISNMNNGVVSENVDIPWENYNNCILLTNKDGSLRAIDLKLNQIISI